MKPYNKNRMIKVLHIISSMDPRLGGVCQALRSIIEGLTDKGVVNEVVCVDSPSSNFLKHDKFIIHAIGPAKTSWSYSNKLKPWLKQNIYNYKIIIVHGLWQYQSYAIYQVWKKLKEKPRLYVMSHGMLDPYFQKAKNRKLKAIRNKIVWKLIENKLINSAQGILFTCEEEKLLARMTFSSYQPQKEEIIGLGVQYPSLLEETITNAFFENCKEWDGKPFLLFLSRIHQKKGIDLLINAYISLKDELNYIPQLIIAGPGLGSIYGEIIKKMAKNCDSILFPGMLSGNAKWGAFHNCEAFILPSHQENFGIAIVEAMASEKPVLITNKVNIWREINKNEAGLVTEDNFDGVYNMLKEWVNMSDSDRKKMAKKARETYLSNFTIENVAEKLIEIIS